MTDKWNDDDIERAFSELRGADAQHVPPFDDTYAAARAAATRRAVTAPRRRAAAAAVILVLAGGGWLALRSGVPASPLQQSERNAAPYALSDWRSPTAFLLQSPGDVLVKTLPTISASSAELNAIGVRAGRRRHS